MSGSAAVAYRRRRGGSWLRGSQFARVHFRDFDFPDYHYIDFGLRLARRAP